MTIGEKIKNRRIALGLSQEELATKCGYKSRSSINKIELARDLPLNKVEIMATALGTTPAELMGWGDTFSIEQAELDAMISNDLKLKEALKVYFSLPDEKKALIIELIKNFQ